MAKGRPYDSHAPVRPLNGYFRFAAEIRQNVAKSNPKWPVKKVMGEIGKQWSALSDAKKAPYTGKAEKELVTYHKEMEKYKKTSHYTKHQAKLVGWKKEQKMKPFKKDPNRPKRALSAYMLFFGEKRAALAEKGLGMTDIAKKVAEMWKALSNLQKGPYWSKAVEAKKKTDKVLETYKKTKQYKAYMVEKWAWDLKRKEAKQSDKPSAKKASAAK